MSFISTYNLCCEQLRPNDVYKLHVAYRKIYRYIYELSLKSSLTDILKAFSIKFIKNVVKLKMNTIEHS